MAQGTKQSKVSENTQQLGKAKSQDQPSVQGGRNQSQALSTGRQGLARREPSPFWGGPRVLDDFRTEMERLFDSFGFGGGLLPSFGDFGRQAFEWTPQTEVFERDNNLVVRADLPGLKKEDVNIDLEENRIAIRGERKSEHEENQGGIYRSERSYGSFYRSIPLPPGVDGDKANATFNDGVLEITMPLPEKRSPGRRIEIK